MSKLVCNESTTDDVFSAVNGLTQASVVPKHYSAVSALLSSALSSSTALMCVMLPVKFSAVRIGVRHLGGFGDMTGAAALVASTDNIGDLSYTNTTECKRFITPMSEGVEHNTLSFLGWKNVTWDSLATIDVTDAGSEKIAIAWSDVIDVQSKPLETDTNGTFDGYYPLLIRFHGGTGQSTSSTQKDQVTPGYFTDSGAKIVLNASRSGEHISTPSTWSQVNTPSFSSTGNLPIIIEAYTEEDGISFMTIGDSRLATAPASESAYEYRTLQWRLERDFAASEVKARNIAAAHGGKTTAEYFQKAETILSDPSFRPSNSIYLIYSINNGQPTDEEMASVKSKALRHLNRCVELGITPMFLTSFPSGTGFTSDEMANLVDLDAFAESTGVAYLSPLAIYGDVNGGWANATDHEDSNHMTPAGYDDLSSRIVAALT